MGDFNYLQELLEVTKEAESPRSFIYWSGLSSLSAVIRRNIWINKRIYKLYPNIYCMLVAKSGLRKGFPVKIAQKLVESTQCTKVISGRNSIQAIILELSRQYTLESGIVLNSAHAFIVNDELGTLLVEDPSAQTILTTLYDSFYHAEWTDTLKSDGRKVLKDICVTMLSATNQIHLTEFLDNTSITGGFIGRTLIVYEEKKSRINPLISEDDNDELGEIDLDKLKSYLNQIKDIKGKCKLTREAKKTFIDWYQIYNEELEKNQSDDTGTSDRIHDQILKISMLLSISERQDLVITKPHIDNAIRLCEEFTTSVKRLIDGKGKGESSDRNRGILDYLLSQDDFTCSRKKLLRAKYGDMSAIELDASLDTMVQAGIITREDSQSEGPIFSIEKSYAEKFKKYLEGKRVL